MTALIPFRKARKRIRAKLLAAERGRRLAAALPAVRARYAAHAAACREKLARGERLKVAFLVSDASMFTGESVFAAMAEDPRFECEIAVAPRVSRGEAFLRDTLAKTAGSLGKKFPGAVRPLYDPDTKKTGRLDADIVFSTVLYEDQTLPEWTTERLSERSLVAMLYYAYGGFTRFGGERMPFLPNVALCWRFFVSNEAMRELCVSSNPGLQGVVKATGYAKMDRLFGMMPGGARSRKRVILAPHHSIDGSSGGLALSTFLKNSEMYLRLPAAFPEIDFVFRPHPLLFPRLETPRWWGRRKVAEYKARLEAIPNVEFQQGGDYFATFADSDALVHDCSSFLAEYFYTGRPQCYLLGSERTVESQFLPFGRRLLDHVFRAYREEDVAEFLRRVVVSGDDPGRAEREAFAAEEVRVNHPGASRRVVQEVLDAIAGPTPYLI